MAVRPFMVVDNRLISTMFSYPLYALHLTNKVPRCISESLAKLRVLH